MIPDWLIRHVCMPYGARLPAKPRPAVQGRLWGEFVYNNNLIPTEREVQEKGWIVHGKVIAGNLLLPEYQFWRGTPYLNQDTAECRWCGMYAWKVDERRKHQREHPECQKMVNKVAELLRRDKLCVICDKRTGRKVFGFPICSNVCLAIWKFATAPTEAFKHARGLVLKA